MKLCYRGLSYESNSPIIETIETEVTAMFRGQAYQVRRPLIEACCQSQMNLKYRCVAYAVNETPFIKLQISATDKIINPVFR